MKLIFVTIISIFLFTSNSFSDVLTKEAGKAKDMLLDTALITKYIFTPPKKAKFQMQSGIKRIESECCEENFTNKEKILNIKKILQKCIENKCQNFMLPVYNRKKLPAKVIALRELKLVDDLIIENDKQKYDNVIKSLEKKEIEKEKQLSEMLENEENVVKLKKNLYILENKLKEMESQNLKLKNTVDKMLSRYQKKISNLQVENKVLEQNFQKARNSSTINGKFSF